MQIQTHFPSYAHFYGKRSLNGYENQFLLTHNYLRTIFFVHGGIQISVHQNWPASSEFGTYRLCEQRRFRRACASAQSRQNLHCSLIQAVSQEEPSERKPDPWPLWMAGHAQLKFVMTECSKTQIRLTGLKYNYCTFKNIVVQAPLTKITDVYIYMTTFVKDCNSMSSATVGQVRLIPFILSPRFDAHSSSSKSFMKQRNKKGDRMLKSEDWKPRNST